MTTTTPIEFTHLDKYICGDRALLDEILTIFEEQAQKWVAKMRPDMPDDDWFHAAHSLKGASRGVGAWAVGDLAEAAEGLVGEGAGQEENRRVILDELAQSTVAAVEYSRLLRAEKT